MKRVIVLALLAACGGKSSSPRDPTRPTDSTAPSDPIAKAVGKPRTDLIPRDIIFGNPERGAVEISPDGKYLSWTAPKDGVMNIWVAPFGKLDEAKVITHETTRPIREYTWAYTSKHLLYKQDIGGDENFHWFRADLADGKVTDLTPFKGALCELAALDPKQPTKATFLINDRDPKALDVHEIDLLTGKRTMVAQNDALFSGFTLDHEMKPRFANKRRDDGSIEIQKRDKDGKWSTWDVIPHDDADTTYLMAFAPTGKAVYAIESRNRDTSALVTIDLAGKKQKMLAEDAKADASNVIVHPTKHHVQAVSFEHLRVRWQVLDASIKKDLDALAKLELGDVKIESRTLDDKLWVVSTASDQKPRRFHLWDRKKQKAAFLFAAQPALDQHALVKMWPLEIPARDGLSLVSYLSLPAAADPDGDGKANTPVPMVLFVHGGPWERDRWRFDPVHQMLANRGYAVLSVNFRGSTGFGKNFLNAGNLQWAKAMHTDLVDAVGWATKAGVTMKDKVCIVGGSYGGYATLVGMSMTPDVFACGVDVVGMSNLHTFIASIPPYWAPELGVLYSRVGNPETPEGKALLTAISPVTHAAKIKRPLLIGQGANDPRVKQAESEQIVAAMKKARLPVTYVVFPDEGHGFNRPVNNIAFFGVTEAFLSAHLGGSYLPLTPEELKATSMQVKDGRAGIPGL